MRAVFPGTFDPPTITHIAIANHVLEQHWVESVDFALSTSPIHKSHPPMFDHQVRLDLLRQLSAADRRLKVVETPHALLSDIAQGYDVLLMGTDKLRQLDDPAYYQGEAHLKEAVSALPRLIVVLRNDPPTEDPRVWRWVELDPNLQAVSSTRVRQGEVQLAANPSLPPAKEKCEHNN